MTDTEVDRSVEADAKRMRWILDGHGDFMEEQGLCGYGSSSVEGEKDEARRAIDKEMGS